MKYAIASKAVGILIRQEIIDGLKGGGNEGVTYGNHIHPGQACMKYFLIIIVVLVCLAFNKKTQEKPWPGLQTAATDMTKSAKLEGPWAEFSPARNKYKTMSITWQNIPNVSDVCNRERKRRNPLAKKREIKACTFWKGNTCLILTANTTTMHLLGDAGRHCYQGNWHS